EISRKAEAEAGKAEDRMVGDGRAERLHREGEGGGEPCPVPEQPDHRQEEREPGEAIADDAGLFIAASGARRYQNEERGHERPPAVPSVRPANPSSRERGPPGGDRSRSRCAARARRP